MKDPQAAAEIIGTTAKLELYDLETSLIGPSISIRGEPIESASLYALLAQVQSQVKEGTSEAYYIVNPKTKRVVSGPVQSEQEALRRTGGKLPANRELFAVPAKAWSSSRAVRAQSSARGPQGSGVAPDRTWYYLFEYDPPNVPQMTGEDFKAHGHARRLRHEPRRSEPADRDDGVHRRGARTSSRRSPATEWIRGKLRETSRSTSRSSSTARSRPSRRSTTRTRRLSGGIGGGRAQIEGLDSFQEAKEIALVLQTGALPVRVRDARSHRHLGNARQGLARARHGRRRSPGSSSSRSSCSLFYRFLGLVAVAGSRSTPPSSTRPSSSSTSRSRCPASRASS